LPRFPARILHLFFLPSALCLLPSASILAAGPDLPQSVSVDETFNQCPFRYEIVSRTSKTGFVVYELTYPSPVVTGTVQNNTVPAEYYLPDGVDPFRHEGPKRPAVICLHILDGNFELVRMTCSVLASHGIPAIMFKLPYYGERGFPEGPRALAADPELFVGALGQALLDVRRTVDLLASRPEVDSRRIGITGISLGGITAATAAAEEPRISRAALILAGGDLESIIHHAGETRDLSELIRRLPAVKKTAVDAAILAVDPLQHAADLRDRAQHGRVLMVNATEDTVIPPACTVKLASALGIANSVVWLDGLGHYTAMAELPRVLRTTVAFFAEDMPEGVAVEPPKDRPRSAVEVLAGMIYQAATLVVTDPQPGRCQFLDVAFSATPKGERTIEGRLSLIRGDRGRFKLECTLPEVGDVAMGQGSCPWMASAEKVVFQGLLGPAGAAADPFAFADPQKTARLRMLSGAAGGVALAPDILSQFCTVRESEEPGARVLQVELVGRNSGSLTVELGDDNKTPRSFTFTADGVRGRVDVRGWQVNGVAHSSMFEPPAGLTVKEVNREDVQRVFGAALDFAMERVQ
jgi:dienelactone hydrolase